MPKQKKVILFVSNPKEEENWRLKVFKPYFEKEKDVLFAKTFFDGIIVKDKKVYCTKNEKEEFKEPLEVDYIIPVFEKNLEYNVEDKSFAELGVHGKIKYTDLFHKIKALMQKNGKLAFMDWELSKICASKITTEEVLRAYKKEIPRPPTYIANYKTLIEYAKKLRKDGYSEVVIKGADSSLGEEVIPGFLDEGGGFTTQDDKFMAFEKEEFIFQGVPPNLYLVRGYPITIRAYIHPILKGKEISDILVVWTIIWRKFTKKKHSAWSGKMLSMSRMYPKKPRRLVNGVAKRLMYLVLPRYLTLKEVFGRRADSVESQIRRISFHVLKAIFKKAYSDTKKSNLNSEWFGLDFICVKNGKDIKVKFLEINSNPGFRDTWEAPLLEGFSKQVVPDILRKVREL